MGINAVELMMFTSFLVAGGIIAGFISGLFGIGAGGILVPILFELFGALGVTENVRMHLAIGTSFAIMIPTSFRAAYSHYRRGSINAKVILALAPGAVIGVIIGSIAAKYTNGMILQVVWIFSASFLSINLILHRKHRQLKGDFEKPIHFLPISTGIGFISTMMGVGGGAHITATLLFYGRPIHQAISTAAGFSCMVAIPALFGYIWAGWGLIDLPPWSFGFVNLSSAAVIIPASVLAAPLGVRVAHILPQRKLKITFAFLMSLVALRFLFAVIDTVTQIPANVLNSIIDPMYENIDLYCERVGPYFWSEPINALSNTTFLFAAWFAWHRAKKLGRISGYIWLLIGLMCSIAIGSASFHTFANKLTQYLDALPILMFQLVFVWHYSRQVANIRTIITSGIILVYLVAALIARQFPYILYGSLIYAPTLLALFIMGVYHVYTDRQERWTIIGALLVFLISIIFRTIDRIICPIFPLGTHFIWHILNGLSLYLLFRGILIYESNPT